MLIESGDPAAPTVPTSGVTVPWQLSARTRAWLIDRPQTRKLVRAIWDEIGELERAGNHPPDVLATLRYLLFEHQILTRAGRCCGCRWRHGSWRRLWRRSSFPCEVWYTVHLGLQRFFTGEPVGPGDQNPGRHAVRTPP